MQSSPQKEYEGEVLELLEALVNPAARPVILLEGGHFAHGEQASEFAAASLRSALTIGELLVSAFGRDLRLVFGTLIDDLGSEQGSFNLKSPKGVLPDALVDILDGHPMVKLERFLLTSERNAKNRALKNLKPLYRGPGDKRIELVREHGQTRITLSRSFESAITLGFIRPSGASAHCPAIMGQHYADCLLALKKRFPLSEQLLVLDWSESMDMAKVTAGVKACHDLFMPQALDDTRCEIANLFFGDSSGSIYELHHGDAMAIA